MLVRSPLGAEGRGGEVGRGGEREGRWASWTIVAIGDVFLEATGVL